MSQFLSHSLSDYLTVLRPEVSPQLISSECWQHIDTVAQKLPSAITPFWGFECPLGTEAASADFLICATAQDGGRQILAGDRDAMALPDSLQSYPIWQQIKKFSREWSTETSLLYSHVHNVWLEFDVSSLSNPVSSPSCFFAPQPIHATASAVEAIAHPHEWITQTALKLLLNRKISEPVQHQLFKCLDALPPDAYVFQIGVMLSRDTDAIRICIRNISPELVLDYLTQLSWSGSPEELRSVLSQFSGYVDRIDLDLDVGETIAPKLGLECYLDQQPLVEPRWSAFLDQLVAEDLCVLSKRDHLLAYPGHIRRSRHPELWSSQLTQFSELLGSKYEIVFLKGLHHIKIAYQPNAPLTAKAYLAIGKTLIDKDALKQVSQTVH